MLPFPLPCFNEVRIRPAARFDLAQAPTQPDKKMDDLPDQIRDVKVRPCTHYNLNWTPCREVREKGGTRTTAG